MTRFLRQMEMDFALNRALKVNCDSGKIPRATLLYDIMCQYEVNLADRIESAFDAETAALVRSFIKEIPKMHLVAHKDGCQVRFSFNYTDGTGRTEGEAAERLWAILNLIAAATKQQNEGHRKDTVQDHIGKNNWSKNKDARE